jgi:pantoate--beta-alanine ligase
MNVITKRPAVAPDLATLREAVAAWHAKGERVALVPTMGALHAGHMALAAEGLRRAERCVVSIFVNPTQFAPAEDFTTYPRTLEHDLDMIAEAGGDLVYAPHVSGIYPEGFATTISLSGPATAGLEDRFRPTHFAGVATIVAKLLIQARPDVALFGEKDFQQLCVIKRLALDLDLPVEIVGVPIVRDADGLALSSRNVYLDAKERAIAPVLHQALRQAARAIRQGSAIETSLQAARRVIADAGFEIDYVEARDSASLAPLPAGAASGRILVAAKLGRTRLIDNVSVEDESWE